jgi:hypothetical protein
LLALRRVIFATAAATPGVGVLTETLKWGEPAHVTAETASGSTIRLGWSRAIVLEDRDALPAEPVRHCIAGALTYHQRRGHERRRS